MEQSRNANSLTAYRERLDVEFTVDVHIEDTLPCGHCIFFALTLFIKPLTDEIAFHRVSHTLGSEDLPEALLSVLVESLHNQLSAGGRYGFPLESLSISITSVDYREGQSTEIAVRLAALAAFKLFLENASLTLIPG